MKFLNIFIILLFAKVCLAFPENVRHGYFSCVGCHVSPSGGGVLTPYGRSLSAELMSTWGTAKQAGFFFTDNENEKINPPWWRGNVFLRGVQTRRNTLTYEKGQFFPMQADFEAGYDVEKFAVVAATGFRAKDLSQSTDLTQFFSRKHYALYRFSDAWSARVGKFMASFGLNGPDHVTSTRRGLGFDEGTESYNLEASFASEKTSILVSLISDSPEEKAATKDKGFAVNQSFFIGNDSKVGFSLFSGEQAASQRNVLGPYWIWTITKEIYLDSEIFYQQKKIKVAGTTENGYATFHRLGYEVLKGLTLYAQFDRSFLDTANENTKYDSYGPGLQWLPYPHFEVMSYFSKEKATGQEATDYWWLMFNVYL